MSQEPQQFDCRVAFAGRPPSANWEPLQIPGTPASVWAWFKPQHALTGIQVQVPPEVSQTVPFLTLRMIAHAAGIDPACIPMCSVYGYAYQGYAASSPWCDQAITAFPAGTDPYIVLYVDPAPGAMPVTVPAPTGGDETEWSSDDQLEELFISIERDWKSTLKFEKQLGAQHKQLTDMLQRVMALDRDLMPEERMCASRQDIDDWTDARRALREQATKLSRYIREYDAGETVYAGKKRWFAQVYKDCVKKRRPFDGMTSAQQEFEVFRKNTQNLVSAMQSAYNAAGAEGERRAQSVLTRIAAQVRAEMTGQNRRR